MFLHQLKIPDGLCKLIQQNVWPTTIGYWQQECNPILGKEAARKLSQEEDKIILMTPPFHTIADEITHGNNWWIDGLTNVGEIDYDKAIIIADFGAGTDSPIILYYHPETTPVIMYLKWSIDGADTTFMDSDPFIF